MSGATRARDAILASYDDTVTALVDFETGIEVSTGRLVAALNAHVRSDAAARDAVQTALRTYAHETRQGLRALKYRIARINGP